MRRRDDQAITPSDGRYRVRDRSGVRKRPGPARARLEHAIGRVSRLRAPQPAPVRGLLRLHRERFPAGAGALLPGGPPARARAARFDPTGEPLLRPGSTLPDRADETLATPRRRGGARYPDRRRGHGVREPGHGDDHHRRDLDGARGAERWQPVGAGAVRTNRRPAHDLARPHPHHPLPGRPLPAQMGRRADPLAAWLAIRSAGRRPRGHSRRRRRGTRGRSLRCSQVSGMATTKPAARGRYGREAIATTGRPPADVAADRADAGPSIPRCENVEGIGRNRHRLGGHTITNARPITAPSGIVPTPGSPWRSRESSDTGRLSPITHRRPGGTVMLNRPEPSDASLGLAPGIRYDCSCSGTPLTVTRPRVLQHTT